MKKKILQLNDRAVNSIILRRMEKLELDISLIQMVNKTLKHAEHVNYKGNTNLNHNFTNPLGWL